MTGVNRSCSWSESESEPGSESESELESESETLSSFLYSSSKLFANLSRFMVEALALLLVSKFFIFFVEISSLLPCHTQSSAVFVVSCPA